LTTPSPSIRKGAAGVAPVAAIQAIPAPAELRDRGEADRARAILMTLSSDFSRGGADALREQQTEAEDLVVLYANFYKGITIGFV
jgi:hypothetical protein